NGRKSSHFRLARRAAERDPNAALNEDGKSDRRRKKSRHSQRPRRCETGRCQNPGRWFVVRAASCGCPAALALPAQVTLTNVAPAATFAERECALNGSQLKRS